MDAKVHELALEILRQHSLMTMREAVKLAREVIKGRKRDQERQCNLPPYCPDCGKEGETKGHQDCQYPQD